MFFFLTIKKVPERLKGTSTIRHWYMLYCSKVHTEHLFWPEIYDNPHVNSKGHGVNLAWLFKETVDSFGERGKTSGQVIRHRPWPLPASAVTPTETLGYIICLYFSWEFSFNRIRRQQWHPRHPTLKRRHRLKFSLQNMSTASGYWFQWPVPDVAQLSGNFKRWPPSYPAWRFPPM